jgi:hypothetical protein
MRPWVLLVSGDRFNVPLMNSALRPLKSVSKSVITIPFGRAGKVGDARGERVDIGHAAQLTVRGDVSLLQVHTD